MTRRRRGCGLAAVLVLTAITGCHPKTIYRSGIVADPAYAGPGVVTVDPTMAGVVTVDPAMAGPGIVTVDPAMAGPGVVTVDPGCGVMEPGCGVIEPQCLTFVDRHPLLRKPVECYHNHGKNPFCNALAATVVGVPVGAVAEVWQVIKGCPPGL